MLLLRYCVCQKFTYLMRITNPHHSFPDGTTFAAKIDEFLCSCLSNLLLYDSRSPLPPDAWTQATLPFAHGGLGLLDAPNTHHAAFVAASVECRPQLHHMHAISTRTDEEEAPPTTPTAEQHYQNLIDTTETFTGADGHEYKLPPFAELADEAEDKLQVAITRVVQACRAHKILQQAAPSMRARLIFCAGTGSAMFQAIPKVTTPHLAFPPDGTAYLAAVSVQLGLAIGFIVAQECVGCTVGERHVNRDGYHLQSQCKKNNSRFRVHDTLRDNLAELIRQGGYQCNTERSDILRTIDDTTQQRTDITVYGWTATGTLEIDVSVTDHRQLLRGGARTTTILPFETSLQREKYKIGKYREKVEEAGCVFEPFVSEKEGLGPNAIKLVEHFVNKAHGRSGVPLSILKNYWIQRLTIAMRLTAMQCLHDSAMNCSRRSPVTVVEEVDKLGILDTNYVCCNLAQSHIV